MVKKIIIAVVLIAAGFFGYKLMNKDECPGGKAFETEAQCTAGGLTAEICASSFKGAKEIAQASKPIETMEKCHLQYPHCEPAPNGAAGFVPKAEKVCIVAGKPAQPLYGTLGPNIAGGH